MHSICLTLNQVVNNMLYPFNKTLRFLIYLFIDLLSIGRIFHDKCVATAVIKRIILNNICIHTWFNWHDLRKIKQCHSALVITEKKHLVCRGCLAALWQVKQVSLWLCNECRWRVLWETDAPKSAAATPPSSCQDEKHKKNKQIRGEWWINFIS